MKTITIEVEDNYWLELSKLLKSYPVRIIEENIKIKQKTPLEEIGFIACGEADEDLSVNYKEKLTAYLKEKHDL